MEKRIGAGLVAGLIAGIVFTLVALFLKTTLPDGEQTSMLVVAAEALHSHGWVAGWIASLIYTAIIGGVFGWVVRAETSNKARVMVWGGLYGRAWGDVGAPRGAPAPLANVRLSSAAPQPGRQVC